MSSRYLPLVGALFSTFAIAQNTVSLAISAQPTSGASGIISPSFAGFGIESSNLYSFTGGREENQLTKNLLENLANYTGTPPHLRIGGNTQDYFIYQDSQDDYRWEPNPDAVGQGAFATDSMIIGPRYFEVINRFPSNTPITFGLNLAYSESDYIEQITTMATQAVNRLSDVNLVSFEIGNEPDLYLQNGFRTGSWGGQVYTQEWLDRADAVYQQVLKPNNLPSNFFEPGATASTIGTSFQIQDLEEFGITVKANGSTDAYISSWNQHDYYYYIGVSTYPITAYSFMTLSTTNDQFAAWVSQIQQAEATGYPYALREMGVVGPIGLADVTDIFGAALWSLNFFLYAATLNITSVQMHMTDNSNASAWQPIEYYGNQPFVRPNYYAFAAFDQLIGPTCQAQVGGYVVPNPPAAYGGRIAAYSVYQAGTLASIVLINSNPANVSMANKPSLTWDLSLPSQFAGQDLYLHYLTNDGADAKHGTTWNGVSYEESGDGTPTLVNDTISTVRIGNDGSVSVVVRDSQAVIANIGSPIGQLQANPSACSALAASTPDARPATTPVGTGQPAPTSTSGTSSSGSGDSSAQSNAATSTRSSATASATSGGVFRLSTMILTTFGAAVSTALYLLCI
ncbi:putative glycoside hydrolase family 79 protein [Cladophialophora carrionii]|uniref:Putative glycoside hydrolase family 79 protein n=1 Tax=Cladophialophora carrionii TaxID=86049 RepID=A0A1C1CE34_9EURO|nr:putative glycoside hydrolase family 79 protein [Cladophialophora carrionii]